MKHWLTEKIYSRFDTTCLMLFAFAISRNEFVLAFSSIIIGATISAIIDFIHAEKDAP